MKRATGFLLEQLDQDRYPQRTPLHTQSVDTHEVVGAQGRSRQGAWVSWCRSTWSTRHSRPNARRRHVDDLSQRARRALKLVHGYQRAGDTEPEVLVTESVVSVDATYADTNLLGHSYIGDGTSILADIDRLLERVRRRTSDGSSSTRWTAGRSATGCSDPECGKRR